MIHCCHLFHAMSDPNEQEDNENAPLLKNEQSAGRKYEGVEPQNAINDQPETVQRDEEFHSAPQQSPAEYHEDERMDATRPRGATVTCRVCSATIIIEGKVRCITFEVPYVT